MERESERESRLILFTFFILSHHPAEQITATDLANFCKFLRILFSTIFNYFEAFYPEGSKRKHFNELHFCNHF